MKKPLLRLTSILMSIFMLFSLSACNQTEDLSQQGAKIKTKWHKSKKDGVIFSVRTDKDSYAIGEEIKLYFKIENKRDSAILQIVPYEREFGPVTTINKGSYHVPDMKPAFYVPAAHTESIKSNGIYESIGSDGKAEVQGNCRFQVRDCYQEIDGERTLVKPAIGKYTVVSKLTYVDEAKLEPGEEYNRKTEETQTVEFEITLTDAPTTTTE